MKTKLTLISTTIAAAMLAGNPVMAQSSLLEGWSGSAGLGLLFTTGNSETENFNANVNISKQQGVWRHSAFGSAFRAENNDLETANRYDLGYKLDRNFTDTVYGFGRLRFDVDDFGNIDSRFTGVVGVGKNFFDDGKQAFSAEIGIGGTDTNFINEDAAGEPLDPDAVGPDGLPLVEVLDDDAGAVLYGSARYSNVLNERVTFNSILSFEVADVNTLTVWDNSLNVSLSERISVIFGILTRNNSDIEGALGDNTDTATRLNIAVGL